MKEDWEKLIRGTKETLLPLAFPAFGLKPDDFTLEGIRANENRINQMYPPGRPMMATTMIPFAVHYGESLVQTFSGAHWNFDAEEIDGISVHVPMPNGFYTVYPFVRVAKFWKDRTDAMSAQYQTLNMINLGMWDPSKMEHGETVSLPDGTQFRLQKTIKVPKNKDGGKAAKPKTEPKFGLKSCAIEICFDMKRDILHLLDMDDGNTSLTNAIEQIQKSVIISLLEDSGAFEEYNVPPGAVDGLINEYRWFLYGTDGVVTEYKDGKFSFLADTTHRQDVPLHEPFMKVMREKSAL